MILSSKNKNKEGENIYSVSKILISFEMYKVFQKNLLFHYLISWTILVQIILDFNSMCRNNSKFYI